MNNELRLLISARDAGAAHHLAPVAKLALQTPGIKLSLIASEPALGLLRAQGLDPSPIEHQTDSLCATARSQLARHQPDAVLVGLSGPDAGIDEALLAEAQVPTFALQDFWGDVNPGFGRYADTYLVRDRLAAELTRQRSGAACLVTGSPTTNTAPDALQQQLLAQRLRDRLRIDRTTPLMLLCSQPLWQQAGYAQSLRDALQRLPQGLLLVRRHPRESTADRHRLRRLLQNHCRTPWRIDDSPLPQQLAGAQLVVSAFSNTGLDRVHYNRAAPGNAASPLFLLQQPKLRRLFRDWTGLAQHPLVSLRAACGIQRKGQLGAQLGAALTAKKRRQCAQKARGLNPTPSAAAEILAAVSQHLHHRAA